MSVDEWAALLDRLAEDAGRILSAPPGTADAGDIGQWTPPSSPLPPALADRAKQVVELQRAAMERTRADLDGIRRHLGAVRRVPRNGRTDAPAYLDVDG